MEVLKDLLKFYKITNKEVMEATGIKSPTTLRLKFNGEYGFTLDEAKAIKGLLVEKIGKDIPIELLFN